MAKLTPKQEKFVQFYIETGNASEAYRRAYSTKNMKPNVIAVKASELLKHGKVAVRLEELQTAHQKRHEVTVDRIVCELAKIAFSNAGDFFKWGPSGVQVKDSEELTDDQRSVVAEVAETKTKDGGTIRVKLQCKQVALEKLGRHLGMFKDLHEHTGKDGGPISFSDTTELDVARRVAYMLGRAVAKAGAPAA